MNELTYANAILLGILQGATEFLPISSSGHLALVQHWLRLKAESDAMLAFDVAVHLGTVLAVIAVFALPFASFLRRLVAELRPGFDGRRAAWLIVALGVVASIPTAVIGLFFKGQLQAAFGKPMWIAAALAVTGALLWSTRDIPHPRRGWRRFGWWRALLIGTGQGIAIMPGISRSGTTISLALLVGIKRRWAGEFSFFIAIPAICGAAVLEAADVAKAAGPAAMQLVNGPLLVGTAAAAVVGYVALRILLFAVRRARLHYFAWYCWSLAIVVLLVLGR